MSARARNLRANKNSNNTGNNKSNSKEQNSSINEDYYRRINIQPAVVDTPMSPRTAKWVRELTPVLEPYNFNLNEISDLIRRCHYDANQIELAVGNVIEDFSGHESGQWTKVGKNRSNGGLKNNTVSATSTNNNVDTNKNKNFNNTHPIKSSKTHSQNSQNQIEGTNTNYYKSTNRTAKHHGHSQTQNQNHSHQSKSTGDQNVQQEPSSGSKSTINNGSSTLIITHISTTKASISNNPIDSTTTWAKLARKNNNSNSITGQPTSSYTKQSGSNSEKSQTINNTKDHKDSSNKTVFKEKPSQDHSVTDRQQQYTQSISSTISKSSDRIKKDQECSSTVTNDNTQSSSPPTSNVYSSGSTAGSGVTAIDLGIKVGGVSPPHGIQIGSGIDYKSQGIGVFLPEGRTIDPSANDGLLFGSFGAVDISKIPENQIQINNSIISDNNSNTANNNSPSVPTNSSNIIGHSNNFGTSNIGAMSVMGGISENNNGISGTGVSGNHLLNGWSTSGSSPSKENPTNNIIVDQGLLHQNASQRNSGSSVSGSNVHTSIKSSGIGNGYMSHSISGNAVNNYSNLPITGQGMVSSGGVYSSNPVLLSGNNGMNYSETVVGGAGSNGSGSGNTSGGNGSNMALAAAAAAAAAAVNPYNYAYLNYAGYTANFPYMVGSTAAFGFPHYNTKPNGHHHPTPVFNQYSQGPGPSQHGLNGVYGIGGTGSSGNTTVSNNTSGNVMVSDSIGVNYHSSSNQSPMTVGGNSTHNHHISSQNPNSYQNIQSMLPPGMSHQQISLGNQQPNVSGNSLQNQINLPMSFNNGGSNEFGVDQTIPQAVFLGQPGTNGSKLDNIGAHPGDFIHHQGYNHHGHIQNPTSNANINSQGNPNTGNPNSHTKGNGQVSTGNFQGNMQYIGKPTSSGSNNTVSGTSSGASGNSSSGNPSSAVNGTTVGTGIDLSHQSQGVGGNTGSGNSNMFLSGRAQNTAAQAGQVGSGQSKQAVNFPGFHSSRTSNNPGFLQHNNNMWNNN